ncbi:cytochrome P450 3A9 [Ixodes scapularis]
MSVTIILLVTLVTLLFWKVHRTFSFWNDKGIPHVGVFDYLLYAYDIFTKPMYEAVRKHYKRHGRFYGSYQGLAPSLYVAEPEVLADVFVKKFKSFADRTIGQKLGNSLRQKSIFNLSGDEWKHARYILSPAFTGNKLKASVPRIVKVTERLTARLIEHAKNGTPAAANELLHSCARDTTAAVVFSFDMDSHVDKKHPLMVCFEKLFAEVVPSWKVLLLFTMPTIFRHLRPKIEAKGDTDDLIHFVGLMADDRRSKQKREDDILQMFLDSGYVDSNGNVVPAVKPPPDGEKPLTIVDITAQCRLFFVAGTDTVMAAMMALAYLFALNPECQEKAIREIDAAVEKDGVTYESIQSMVYLEACAKEAMRMYPAAMFLMRTCTQETTLAGINFKPGMNVDIPIAGIHYDPEFYPDPESFKPERFLPENKDSHTPYTFLPFGSGPRNCVGIRMGYLIVKVVFACLLQHVKFGTCPETMIPLKLKPRCLLPLPRRRVMLQVYSRS